MTWKAKQGPLLVTPKCQNCQYVYCYEYDKDKKDHRITPGCMKRMAVTEWDGLCRRWRLSLACAEYAVNRRMKELEDKE